VWPLFFTGNFNHLAYNDKANLTAFRQESGPYHRYTCLPALAIDCTLRVGTIASAGMVTSFDDVDMIHFPTDMVS